MILRKFTKQPAEFKDYDVDYSPWLGPMSDTLDNVEHSVICTTTPTDTALVVDRVEITTTRAKVWVRGGTADESYKVTLRAATVGGRIDESELAFDVKEY